MTPGREVVVRTEEGRRCAERVRGASAFIASAQPRNGGPRLDVGRCPATVSRRDPDRRAAVAAAGRDLDVAIQHGADAERVDRAHGADGAAIQPDMVASILVGERIGADDPLAVKDGKVTLLEVFEEPAGGRFRQAGLHRQGGERRCAAIFRIKLQQ